MIDFDPQVQFRRLSGDFVRLEHIADRDFLVVEPGALKALAEEAFHDISYFLRTSHLEKLAGILSDREASDNDRYVAEALLRNSAMASEGLLPMCQDTGTATIVAWKGDRVLVGGEEDDSGLLSRGVFDAYRKNYLRYSQVAPRSMFEEADTLTNLPAQIDLYAERGSEYRFLFIAKGGGSANKTSFFQESKALLNEESLEKFMREKVAALGTAACPPYHLAMVIGGLSPEMNLKTLKLASTGLYDGLPAEGDGKGASYLDRMWSGRLLQAARDSGLGAQFGGRHLALDARVIRLPRHAGSCPVSLGVSCSADRNALGKITKDGVFLESLDHEPGRFLSAAATAAPERPGRGAAKESLHEIDLDRPMAEIRNELSRLSVGSLVLFSGTMIVARDIAHARLFEMMKRGESLPAYFLDHPVYYAGPAKTPPGYAIGSFGPTTAQRMDSYLPEFMQAGASLVSLAKGNRSSLTTRACREHGGFYLGTIGGAAALLAAENIISSEVIGFPELGMEAVRKIRVKNFPAFILVDDKGNDYYAEILAKRM